jgi:teichuronic acid biosynthesis glycosyltransferase TuaC
MDTGGMRTAIVTTSYPSFKGDPSGHFVQAEARATHADVVVIAPRVRPWGSVRLGPCNDGEDSRVEVLRLPASDAFGWPGFASRLRAGPWRAVPAIAWMRRAAQSLHTHGPFDRVIAHWALPCAWPIVCGSHTKAELEVVSHGGDVRLLLALPSIVRTRVTRQIAERARRWRFVSASLLAELTHTLPQDDARRLETIAVVGACRFELPDVRDAIAAKRTEHAGARLYVSASRLVASKRVDRVIEHVASLGALDAPARLVVVGDGPERKRLERLARARRLDARFVGLVRREDALAWIGAAEAVVHASRAEGQSTLLREAEALGVRIEAVD